MIPAQRGLAWALVENATIAGERRSFIPARSLSAKLRQACDFVLNWKSAVRFDSESTIKHLWHIRSALLVGCDEHIQSSLGPSPTSRRSRIRTSGIAKVDKGDKEKQLRSPFTLSKPLSVDCTGQDRDMILST